MFPSFVTVIVYNITSPTDNSPVTLSSLVDTKERTSEPTVVTLESFKAFPSESFALSLWSVTSFVLPGLLAVPIIEKATPPASIPTWLKV